MLGTYDRPTERPIKTKDDIYEFIIFRGSDVRILDIAEPLPPANTGTSESDDASMFQVDNALALFILISFIEIFS